MKKVFLSLFAASASLFATMTPSYLPENAPDCALDETPSTLSIRHREHEGVGYKTGYTTLDFFFTPNWVRNFQPFFNVRGHVMNDGTFAANVGLGARGAPIEKLALGGNFFFDYREVKSLPSYQLGSGLDILSPYVDFRINGYLPVGHKTKTYRAKFNRFRGNEILLEQRLKAELATVYGEFGAPIPFLPDDFQLYVAAGPYYIGKRHIEVVNKRKIKVGDKWGGKYRIAARIFEYFDAGIELTHDSMFHTNVQGYVGVTLPFGPSRLYRGLKKRGNSDQCRSSRKFRQMMTQPVMRNEIIPVYSLYDRTIPATDAAGNILDCIFVNLSAAPGGNGTFEAPFQTLAEAEAGSAPGDCIIVFNGGGVYTQGIILQERQSLVGAASSFVVDGTTIGPFDAAIPQVIYSGNLLNDPIITLANDVLVKGLYLESENTFGGPNTIIDIANAGNFIIEDNQIIGGDDYGISKVGASSANPIAPGNKIIRNNTFTNNGKSAPTGKNGTIYLIFQDSSNIEITGNTFYIPPSTSTSNRNAFVMIGTDGAISTVNISNNTIHGFDNFINTFQDASVIAFDQPGITNSTGSINVTIDNNVSDAANNIGIFINGTSEDNTYSISNNTFSNLNDSGGLSAPLGVSLDTVNTNDSRYVILMNNNTFTKLPAATNDPGVKFDNRNHIGDQVCLTMTGTTAAFANHENEDTHPASQFVIKSSPAGQATYQAANTIGTYNYTPAAANFSFQDTTFPCPTLP